MGACIPFCHLIAWRRAHGGFSYVEVMLAVLLLGLCIAPAVDAVRDSLAAPDGTQSAAKANQCLKNQMEKVIAEPYQKLTNAAALGLTPSAVYSLPADTDCPIRNVFITHYTDTAPYVAATETGLLYVGLTRSGIVPELATLVAR